MSVVIGQEFRKLGCWNLVVCGFSKSGNIQVYQKVKLRGSNITRTKGKKFRISVGTIVRYSKKKQWLIVGQNGMDWFARNPKETLEFTEEQLVEFDAEAKVETTHEEAPLSPRRLRRTDLNI